MPQLVLMTFICQASDLPRVLGVIPLMTTSTDKWSHLSELLLVEPPDVSGVANAALKVLPPAPEDPFSRVTVVNDRIVFDLKPHQHIFIRKCLSSRGCFDVHIYLEKSAILDVISALIDVQLRFEVIPHGARKI